MLLIRTSTLFIFSLSYVYTGSQILHEVLERKSLQKAQNLIIDNNQIIQ